MVGGGGCWYCCCCCSSGQQHFSLILYKKRYHWEVRDETRKSKIEFAKCLKQHVEGEINKQNVENRHCNVAKVYAWNGWKIIVYRIRTHVRTQPFAHGCSLTYEIEARVILIRSDMFWYSVFFVQNLRLLVEVSRLFVEKFVFFCRENWKFVKSCNCFLSEIRQFLKISKIHLSTSRSGLVHYHPLTLEHR